MGIQYPLEKETYPLIRITRNPNAVAKCPYAAALACNPPTIFFFRFALAQLMEKTSVIQEILKTLVFLSLILFLPPKLACKKEKCRVYSCRLIPAQCITSQLIMIAIH